MSNVAYEALVQHARETALLVSVDALLGWDERCLLPSAAGEYRADQMTLLSGMIHERQTDPRIGDWLAELSDGPLSADRSSDSGATIRQLKRQYEKKIKLPKKLVEALARATVIGQQTWQTARQRNDFASFRPCLEEILALKREQADALDHGGERYDALLDEYEQGETTANLTRVLGALRDELVPLVAAIGAAPRRPNTDLLRRPIPIAAQEAFSRFAAEKIGFDFSRGRLDVSAHPFCSGMGPHDCRLTTRYQESFFPSAFFGVLHEAGHGIYEQGLPPERHGLPTGDAVSLGIHESQSRLWENFVGRGRAFWCYFLPLAKQHPFLESLNDVKLDEFHFAINDVRPSLIRVEADEATYNLHILIRFELERSLLADEIRVDDLPAAWNDKYRRYLGITPDSDANGVMQDIHWSAGLFGYFPTYSLGNLNAAQLFAQADSDLGGLDALFARGEFQPLRDWLRQKIHCHGQRYSASQLIERATGRPLSHRPLIEHLRSKLGPLYGVAL